MEQLMTYHCLLRCSHWFPPSWITKGYAATPLFLQNSIEFHHDQKNLGPKPAGRGKGDVCRQTSPCNVSHSSQHTGDPTKHVATQEISWEYQVSNWNDNMIFHWSPPWHAILDTGSHISNIQHSIWHSFWQIFWHSIWHSFWRSIWLSGMYRDILSGILSWIVASNYSDTMASILAPHLTSFQAFIVAFYLACLAFCPPCVRVQACPAASGARDISFTTKPSCRRGGVAPAWNLETLTWQVGQHQFERSLSNYDMYCNPCSVTPSSPYPAVVPWRNPNRCTAPAILQQLLGNRRKQLHQLCKLKQG